MNTEAKAPLVAIFTLDTCEMLFRCSDGRGKRWVVARTEGTVCCEGEL